MRSGTELGHYATALREHLRHGGEESLLHAYEVGRDLMQEGFGVLDVVRLHADAVADTEADGADPDHQRAATDFLAEVLGAFEMAYRGYEEANSSLRRLAATLEEQVEQRTRELQESLSALQAADAERDRLLGRVVSAQEQERHRIADDLHDDTIQVLAAVVMRLSMLSDRVDPTDQPLVARLEDSVSDAIGRLRRMMFELRPPALDHAGLAAAIRMHLDTTLEGPEPTVDDRLDAEPPIETREIAYRIVQEAVANIRKHARASRVAVGLTSHRDGLHVAVVDDGVGFEPARLDRPQPGHLGVTAMRERAALAGGTCTIDSAPGQGTTVKLWLPHRAPTGP